jgi:RND family efflux transporter MFP subunit
MRGVALSWPVAFIVAVSLVIGGIGSAYLFLPRPAPSAGTSTAPAVSTLVAASTPLADVAITLSDEAVQRAGVVAQRVTSSEIAGSIRLSGTVEPNGYRQVVVAPLVSGRVTRVAVMLGDRVEQNTPLVEIYSPELAEVQTRFLSMRAEFQAVEQEIARTDRLVEIGAASQQELERIHAEHVRHRTEVESTRARLQLLGMTQQQIEEMTSAGQVVATTTIASPIAGVVTARAVNPGTSVDASTPLVTIVDLSSVWVVGDVYERDLSLVSVGSQAEVTTGAFPDARIGGKVAYIDPQVRSETRTARVRVEVPNPRQQLRLGMYANVTVATPGAKTQSILIPRSAVQNVADRTVVYLADPQAPGRFIEREVRLGELSGDRVVVVSGLQRDDQVVNVGSFALRAERERLGLRTAP